MSLAITQKRFVSEALEAHNRYRKKHNAPPLELDSELNNLARDWAEHLAETNQLVYRNAFHKKLPIGENILRTAAVYLSGKTLFSVSSLIKDGYDKKKYKYFRVNGKNKQKSLKNE
jgi:hypothetical protein